MSIGLGQLHRSRPGNDDAFQTQRMQSKVTASYRVEKSDTKTKSDRLSDVTADR
jgi:hypothetical protein